MPASENLHIFRLMRCNKVGAVLKALVRLAARRAASWPPSDRTYRSLGEPAIDRNEKIVGLLPLALIAPSRAMLRGWLSVRSD